MKKIEAGMFVRAVGFSRAFKVNTCRNYTNQAAHDRALANGHDTAWCVNPGTMLVGDRSVAARMVREESENFLKAVVVGNGEQVEIEGEVMTVRVVGERYSDPIHFKR